MKEWRKNILKNYLLPALIFLEIILSVIFIIVFYSTSNIYFKGVFVGLTISWVTLTIAYFFQKFYGL